MRTSTAIFFCGLATVLLAVVLQDIDSMGSRLAFIAGGLVVVVGVCLMIIEQLTTPAKGGPRSIDRLDSYLRAKLASWRHSGISDFQEVERRYCSKQTRRSRCQIEAELARLEAQTSRKNKHIGELLEQLLPIETQARDALELQRTNLLTECQRERESLSIEWLDSQYKRLSPAFLRAKQPTGDGHYKVPSFAVFRPSCNQCNINMYAAEEWTNSCCYRGINSQYALPVFELAEHFHLQETVDSVRLQQQRNYYSKPLVLNLRAAFVGVLPDEIRHSIESPPAACSLAIITRAPNWNFDEPESSIAEGSEAILVAACFNRFWLMKRFTILKEQDLLAQALEPAL